MNHKRTKPVFQVLNSGREEDSSASFQAIISKQFPLIERLCFHAVRRQLKTAGEWNNPLNIENQSLELCNQVLDTLQRDDFRVLRQFKGNSKFSTYLTTIVARQAVDMIRKKMGRNREKERAQKFGNIGLLIYEKMILQGADISEFFSSLKSDGITLSLEDVMDIAQKIKGKKSGLSDLPENNSVVKDGSTINEEGEYIIPDTDKDPQDLLMKKQKEQQLGQVVKTVISQLNGEERLILRMRFPSGDEEKPGKIEGIAKVLGISEKAVYKRMAKIMQKCRDLVARQGVTIHDLF